MLIQLDIRRSRVRSPRVRQHSFMKIDYELFSMVILSVPLIQEGQLSVSGKRMCTSTGSPLRGLSMPRKKCGKVN